MLKFLVMLYSISVDALQHHENYDFFDFELGFYMYDEAIIKPRMTIPIPFSVMEVIKRIEEQRIGDGRTNVTKTSIAIELLDIGARIEKRKLDAMEKGESLYQNRLDDQLAFIAHTVVRTNQKFDRFFKLYQKVQDIDTDVLLEIIERTPLKEKEVKFLKELFAALEGYDYE